MIQNKKMEKPSTFVFPANRKGQGISINVIIIAAIALLVLVILAVLIARSSGNLSDSGKSITKGGTCKKVGSTGVCTQTDSKYLGGADLCSSDEVCCSPV